MKKKMQINLLIMMILMLLFLLGGCNQYQKNISPSENTADTEILCTADVQECPDGSFVARDPNNNCEFKECLNIIEKITL